MVPFPLAVCVWPPSKLTRSELCGQMLPHLFIYCRGGLSSAKSALLCCLICCLSNHKAAGTRSSSSAQLRSEACSRPHQSPFPRRPQQRVPILEGLEVKAKSSEALLSALSFPVFFFSFISGSSREKGMKFSDCSCNAAPILPCSSCVTLTPVVYKKDPSPAIFRNVQSCQTIGNHNWLDIRKSFF